MAGYIYIPIPTLEMLEFAQDWQDGQRLKNKEPYQILKNAYDSGWRKGAMRNLGFGALKNVTAVDKVYILAHAAALNCKIVANRGATKQGLNNWVGGTPKSYSPQALATVLRNEKLPLTFSDLRVFACGSGIVPADSTVSFAQGLAQALRFLGYAHISVTGYLGNVKTSYAPRKEQNAAGQLTQTFHKGVEITNIGTEIFPASSRKVTF